MSVNHNGYHPDDDFEKAESDPAGGDRSTRSDDERAARLTREAETVIRAYEARYSARRAPRLTPEPEVSEEARPRRQYIVAAETVSTSERRWAAFAHASAWLTLLGGFVTLGFGIPLTVLVPLGIYFAFRRRSDFVAQQALQAFTLQLLATGGAMLVGIVGGAVWLVGLALAILSMMVVVGFVVVPLWAIVGLLLALGVAVMPILMLFLATIGAMEAFAGRAYRYPLIAGWLDRMITGEPRKRKRQSR